MIIKHKAKRADNMQTVEGLLITVNGNYNIQVNENEVYTVFPNTIEPCLEDVFCVADIITSDKLTEEEADMFMGILRKARS